MRISIPGLGGRLRRARNKTGLSQEKVAEWVGVSWMTVHRWERSHRAIPDHLLDKLCVLYKRPLRWFLTLEPGDLEEDNLESKAATGNGLNKVSERVALLINGASEEDLLLVERVLAPLLTGLSARRS